MFYGDVYDDNYSMNKTLIGSVLLSGAAATAAFYLYWSTSDRTGSRKLPGLLNLGNTCYTNSLLQALASCPSLVAWLTDLDLEEARLQGGFIDALRSIVIGLNEPNGNVLSAGNIVTALSAHGWNISIGVEHDLYELFNVFVTTWEDELKNGRRNLLHGSIEDCTQAERETMSRQQLSFERCAGAARLDARLRAPCIGLTATEFRCMNSACNYRTIKYESFSALTLTIPNSQMGTPTNIEHILRRYFCSEVIRDATCDQCKENSRKQKGFLKKHGIVKMPQTLLIRLERVGMLPSGHLKLNEHVSFSEHLSVQEVCFRRDFRLRKEAYEESQRKWELADGSARVFGGAEIVDGLRGKVTSSLLESSDPRFPSISHAKLTEGHAEAERHTYQLRAVCEHRGGPFSGHFVTYRRGPAPNSFNWFLTNDSQVNQVAYKQVGLCQAYMLFYERLKPNRWYKRG